MKHLPLKIIKKSSNWYYDTYKGKYIHADKLQAYVDEKAQLKLKI